MGRVRPGLAIALAAPRDLRRAHLLASLVRQAHRRQVATRHLPEARLQASLQARRLHAPRLQACRVLQARGLLEARRLLQAHPRQPMVVKVFSY